MEKNIYDKYAISELLEKTYRLHTYISQAGEVRFQNVNSKTIEVFNVIIKKIEDIIKSISADLKAGDFNEREIFTIKRKIARTFILINNVHSELQFIHSDWVLKETYTFSESLIKLTGINSNEEINIVLTDEYSFRENNLLEKFTDHFKFSSIDFLEYNNKYPTLILPKMEYSNPLNWVILAHEIGHICIDDLKQLVEDQELIPDDLDVYSKQVLKKWAEELYCDIFAINVLGPCFVASFGTFALATATIGGNGNHSGSHPSNTLRLGFLSLYLLEQKSELMIQFGNYKENVVDFFINLLEDFEKPMRKQIGLYIENEASKVIDQNIDLTNFLSVIHQRSKSFSSQFAYKNVDTNKIDELADRLRGGMPIGCFHAPVQLQDDQHLKDMKAEELESIKELITDKGNSLLEILNAGWKTKFSQQMTFIETVLDGSDVDLDKSISYYYDTIANRDDRLLKSIESSEIYSLLEE
ncbi:hypothetical protein BH09PAT2_BH09PAT2_08500 [soil metagenome]